MKVRPSVKPMCDKCKVIKRNGKVMVICPKYPNHPRIPIYPKRLSALSHIRDNFFGGKKWHE